MKETIITIFEAFLFGVGFLLANWGFSLLHLPHL